MSFGWCYWKMLIYGCNATGKTNLGKALLNITLTMFGIIRYTGNGILLNADSKEDAATFQYEFQFDDTELSYKYWLISQRPEQYRSMIFKSFIIAFSPIQYSFFPLRQWSRNIIGRFYCSHFCHEPWLSRFVSAII